MLLKIGDAIAFRRPEDWTVTPDDRQQVHQTINGAVVEDYGHVDTGDVITCTVILSRANFNMVYNYWQSRTHVKVVDVTGQEWDNARVVLKEYSYINRHESFYKVKLEFWRV